MNDLSMFAEEIAQSLTMFDLLEHYGFSIERGYVKCPFHTEKTGSLRVWQDHWHCFGCGAHGNQIVFVRKLFDVDFASAIKRINEDFGLNLPIDNKISIRQSRMIKKRKCEIEEARRRELILQKQSFDNYYALVDYYLELKQRIKEFRPKCESESLHPLFVEAISKINYVDYILNSTVWKGGPRM